MYYVVCITLNVRNQGKCPQTTVSVRGFSNAVEGVSTATGVERARGDSAHKDLDETDSASH